MLLFGRMCILVLRIWKALECFKWGLMGQSSRNMEDGDTEGHMNCLCLLAQKVSVEKNFSMWPKDYLSELLEKHGCFLPLSEETT